MTSGGNWRRSSASMQDPRFKTNADRLKNRDALNARHSPMDARTKMRSRFADQLQRAGVPAESCKPARI